MPAPPWFFRFVYDRESAASAQRRDEPQHRRLVERTVEALAEAVPAPGPVADLGCGSGAHSLALARRGYDVVGLDVSPRMVDVARARATSDGVGATFQAHDVGGTLPFADGSLGGVLAVLVLQHLTDRAAFVAEVRRCLRPGGHVLLTVPVRDGGSVTAQRPYWRLRATFYRRVPGMVRFDDATSLRELLTGAGLVIVASNVEPGRVTALART